MQRSETRILTTHTGSLPRPPELTRLYAMRVRGQTVDEVALAAAGRDAVRWVVPRQIEAGIDIINNGEQPRDSFVLYVRQRLSGLGGTGSRLEPADVDNYPMFKRERQEQAAVRFSVSNFAHTSKVIGAIRYANRPLVEEECTGFGAALADNRGRYAEAFFTAASPGIVATIMNNEYYDTQESYLAAIGAALRIEYETIVGHGFVLQLDCPDLAMERHMAFRYRPLSEYLAFVELVVDTINTALTNLPRERVRLHLCWGNYEGPHDQDVPLAEVLPIVKCAKVGGFVLPFGNARHAHEFRVLEKLRLDDDQILIAGVIDTLTNVIEHPETVADRLERIAGAIGDPCRLIAGTDCGFDTSAGNSRVAPDVAWGKLKSLSEGAAIASKRLFGR
ncbi:MAG: methionine synthase [Proteobacteria bacterium]|nr:methionine synthase [Pseudomonadota bacterium]